MNRKNLTAAVLAGLAGVAGIAGTAQAVNLNPDGLGEVLIYPYYSSNDGNQTLLTVVNTTAVAKAVKIRFLEGYNSREVLDFNIYLSKYDVWVAAIANSSQPGAGGGVDTATLYVPDTTCTVPYLYGMGVEEYGMGVQPFLPYSYTGDNEDGGPTDIARASEGYFEIIEMGQMTGEDGRTADEGGSYGSRIDSATAATHVLDDDTGEIMPEDCELLVRNWTDYDATFDKDDPWDGWWYDSSLVNSTGPLSGSCDDPDDDDSDSDLLAAGCGQADPVLLDSYDDDGDVDGEVWAWSTDGTGCTFTDDADDDEWPEGDLHSDFCAGGLFGAASLVNVPRGTMYSYDARAIQGFDDTEDGIHFIPGTIHPSLNDGDNATAFINLGTTVAPLSYPEARSVEAVSAVFMHNNLANTFNIEEALAASTEWVITHPTKAWYVDETLTALTDEIWEPNPADDGCNGWDPGEPFPNRIGADVWDQDDYCILPGTGTGGACVEDDAPPHDAGYEEGWDQCTYVDVGTNELVIPPFTELFDGEACEEVTYRNWDREESPTNTPGGARPPTVSPAPPPGVDPDEVPFELCYEVNVLRYGDGSIFGTTSDLLLTVSDTPESGWANINFSLIDDFETEEGVELEDLELHQDRNGLIGLPSTGFAAEQYVNGTLDGGSVLANYGGLFGHKGSVRLDFSEYECEYHRPFDVCASS